MKSRSRARRVAIVIKREKQLEDITKLETTHQQWSLSQIPSSTATSDTAINIKKENSKNYILADNDKQEKSLTKISSYNRDNTSGMAFITLKVGNSNQKPRAVQT